MHLQYIMFLNVRGVHMRSEGESYCLFLLLLLVYKYIGLDSDEGDNRFLVKLSLAHITC